MKTRKKKLSKMLSETEFEMLQVQLYNEETLLRERISQKTRGEILNH